MLQKRISTYSTQNITIPWATNWTHVLKKVHHASTSTLWKMLHLWNIRLNSLNERMNELYYLDQPNDEKPLTNRQANWANTSIAICNKMTIIWRAQPLVCQHKCHIDRNSEWKSLWSKMCRTHSAHGENSYRKTTEIKRSAFPAHGFESKKSNIPRILNKYTNIYIEWRTNSEQTTPR